MNDELTTLIRLSDSGLTLADPDEDIRGLTVVDRDDAEIGKVDDLFLDEAQQRLRFLQVGSGGFLGLGKEKRLIPVDAVTATDEQVRVNLHRDRVVAGPGYDPELTPIPERPDIEDVYGHYGIMPFWGAGYTYPVDRFKRPQR